MTPHSVIESMTDLAKTLGPKLPNMFDIEMWLMTVDALRLAPTFDFGAVTPRHEHGDFAEEAMKRNLFRLPFDMMFLTAKAMPHTGLLVMQGVDADGFNELTAITCGPMMTKSRDIMFHVPIMINRLRLEMGAGGASNEMGFRGDWKSLTKSPHASRKTGKVWGDAEYEAACSKVFSFVLGATALLMSKDTQQKIEPAPERLNKVRITKGRPPVGERRVISIRPELRAAYARSAQEEGDYVDRKAATIHFRRGHWRELAVPRRKDGARFVPVAPSVINAQAGVMPLLKDYKING
jgi:hypothetical protein